MKNEEEQLQLAYTRAPSHLLKHFTKEIESNIYKVIFEKGNNFKIDFSSSVDDLVILKFDKWDKKDVRTLLYRND